jgi:hypothetical protein
MWRLRGTVLLGGHRCARPANRPASQKGCLSAGCYLQTAAWPLADYCCHYVSVCLSRISLAHLLALLTLPYCHVVAFVLVYYTRQFGILIFLPLSKVLWIFTVHILTVCCLLNANKSRHKPSKFTPTLPLKAYFSCKEVILRFLYYFHQDGAQYEGHKVACFL